VIYTITERELYKSVDGGRSFQKANLSDYSFRSVGVSDANPDIVFVGTAFDGLYISKDGGSSFVKNSFYLWHGFGYAGINRIFFLEQGGKEMVLLGTTDGLSMTLDYGNTWSFDAELNKYFVLDIFYHENANRLYVAAYGGGALVKTLPENGLWNSWITWRSLESPRAGLKSQNLDNMKGTEKMGAYSKETLYKKQSESKVEKSVTYTIEPKFRILECKWKDTRPCASGPCTGTESCTIFTRWSGKCENPVCPKNEPSPIQPQPSNPSPSPEPELSIQQLSAPKNEPQPIIKRMINAIGNAIGNLFRR